MPIERPTSSNGNQHSITNNSNSTLSRVDMTRLLNNQVLNLTRRITDATGHSYVASKEEEGVSQPHADMTEMRLNESIMF